jgi:hypothetical protein
MTNLDTHAKTPRIGIPLTANHLYAMLQELVQNKFSKAKEILDWVRRLQLTSKVKQFKHRFNPVNQVELAVENNEVPFMYTEDQLMARLKFFIGICLALTLTGIVFVVLYSIIFITQPLNAISPIDQKFFEMIIPIATFLTGTLSGIMLAGNDKDLKAQALNAATKPTPVSPAPTTSTYVPPTPTVSTTIPIPIVPVSVPVTTVPTNPVVGYGGKLAPPPATQPEI